MTKRAQALALAFALSLHIGCVPPHTTPPQGEAERRALTTRLVNEFALPRLASLQSNAGALVDATLRFEATGGVDGADRTDAREALMALQATWQQLEILQLGPAGAPTVFAGGQGLRDGINSWPLVSPCSADQQIVQNRLTEPDFIAGRLVNTIGLHTLEYLLFRDDTDNACPAAASINANGTWQAIGPTEITARRSVFARVLAHDIKVRVDALASAWTTGFGDELKSAGAGSTLFSSAQQALDEVYAALFFLELKTKDRKLAVPAGLHIDCADDVCPTLTESPYARQSLVHITENLRGARLVFLGENDDGIDGPGFDDLLRSAGHDDAATTITAAADVAVAAAEGFEGTIEDVLVTEPERVRALHATVKVFTDELKGTLPSLLGLRVPDEGAGDND